MHRWAADMLHLQVREGAYDLQGLLQLFHTHVVHLLLADRAAFESLRCCTLTGSHSVDILIDLAPGLLLLPAAVAICVTVTWRIRRQTRHKIPD